jgi:endonuclease-3 related protein
LYRAFGPQRWWPARTPLEVVVGAILTQNTAWSNVAAAIKNLKGAGVLSFKALADLPEKRLARLIRPAGYFNIKARRLKHFLAYFGRRYQGRFERMRRGATPFLREELLAVNGIGPETADSILLYALKRPVFVVDAYTKRIFSRHGLCASDEDYHALQKLFQAALPRDEGIFNEYHALIVACAKEFCRKVRPRCGACPLHE